MRGALKWTLMMFGAVLLAGCAMTSAGRETRTTSDMQWHGRIYAGEQGELSEDQVSVANATVTRLATGSTRATVTLQGGLTAASYPWHIHAGTCGSQGAIVGNPDSYGELSASASGMGSATANLDAPLDPAKSYYINLHREDMGIVACGNLRRGSHEFD
jgi:hypothetical protein